MGDMEADSVLLPSDRSVQLEVCEEESDRLASLFVLEEVLRVCQVSDDKGCSSGFFIYIIYN